MNLHAFLIVFRTELSAKFTLRGKLISDLFLQAFKLVVPLLTWSSLYENKTALGGYDFQEMVTYIVIMNFIGFIFSMGHGSEFAAWIKSGRLSSLLLRPAHIINELFAKFCARVFFNGTLILIPILIFQLYFNLESTKHVHFLSYLLVVLNLIFCFFFGLLFGLSAFWLEEVWPLSHLVRALISIAGGLWFPLTLLPWNLGSWLTHTPFAHLGFLNGVALTGKLTDSELRMAVAKSIVWIFISVVLYRFLSSRGIQKYEAVGG